MTNNTKELVERLTRPIIGIENRTAQEAFDIMADRIRSALSRPQTVDREAIARTVAEAIWGPDAASVYFDSHRNDERYHRSMAAADAILALMGDG